MSHRRLLVNFSFSISSCVPDLCSLLLCPSRKSDTPQSSESDHLVDLRIRILEDPSIDALYPIGRFQAFCLCAATGAVWMLKLLEMKVYEHNPVHTAQHLVFKDTQHSVGPHDEINWIIAIVGFCSLSEGNYLGYMAVNEWNHWHKACHTPVR